MAPAMPSMTSKEILSSGGVICPPMITTKSLTWRLLEAEERKASSTRKFGEYGGRFVPETLMTCLDNLGAEFNLVLLDAKFQVKFVDGNFKVATSEAIRNWVGNLETSYYLAGTAVGPHPCSTIVREFRSIIRKETRKQSMEKWGGKPDVLVACVASGCGSNALRLFHDFLRDEDVKLIGVEASGSGVDSERHSATLARGEVGAYY
ncbi:hypothetical protein LOK49_LG09G00365 [Camellia lanceoleosa]|uniref:Uncharacterized protein n=1 Tax=Camellia lanceoleosa TaxID=1840588 RepID=A0ACC0GMK2_9ERIC|nr:hypothetical protein LOK49_LG09G00365 [Camellia lanceoleosa]